IARRVSEVYSALVRGRPVPPAGFRSSLDLLEEEESYRRTNLDRDRAYWLAALRGRNDAVALSTKPPSKSRTFIRRSGSLPATLVASLAAVSRGCGATFAQAIEASVALYVHRLTGAEEVILGVPLTARLGRKMRSIPGVVSNILPLRLSFAGAGTL